MIPLRDETPTRIFPFVTLSIIILNIAVFLIEFAMGKSVTVLFYRYGMIPARFLSNWNDPATFITLFTSMFLHSGWMHLIGNMVFLWVFGDNIEDRMGYFRFFLFYICAGVAGSLVQTLAGPTVRIPTVGASGAIAGVLGTYMLLYPRARIRVLITGIFLWPVVTLPSILVLGGWFLLQLLNGWLSLGAVAQTGGTAWGAHIGGFIAGMLLLPIFRNRNIPPPPRAPYYFKGSDLHTKW